MMKPNYNLMYVCLLKWYLVFFPENEQSEGTSQRSMLILTDIRLIGRLSKFEMLLGCVAIILLIIEHLERGSGDPDSVAVFSRRQCNKYLNILVW